MSAAVDAPAFTVFDAPAANALMGAVARHEQAKDALRLARDRGRDLPAAKGVVHRTAYYLRDAKSDFAESLGAGGGAGAFAEACGLILLVQEARTRDKADHARAVGDAEARGHSVGQRDVADAVLAFSARHDLSLEVVHGFLPGDAPAVVRLVRYHRLPWRYRLQKLACRLRFALAPVREPRS